MRVLGASIAIGAGLLMAGQASAFVEHHHGHAKEGLTTKAGATFPIGDQVVRPGLVVKQGSQIGLKSFAGSVAVDSLSGAPRVYRGAALAGKSVGSFDLDSLIDQAHAFLADRAEIGVDVRDLALDKSSVHLSKDEQFLKFRVSRDGLAIRDAHITFHFKFGSLVQVVNQSFAEASVVDTGVTQPNSKALVDAELDAVHSKQLGEALRVQATSKGYELVRVVEFHVTTDHGNSRVSTNANTGELFEVKPLEHYLDGSAEGHIHERWYNDPLEVRPYSFLNLEYAGGTVTTDGLGNFAGIPDNATPRMNGFKGTKINVVPETGTSVTQDGSFQRDGWRVIYLKNDEIPAAEDKNVAQSMIFYHGNYIVELAKQHIESPWLDRQLRANANLSRTCNAHWDGTTINFYSAGGGCGNTGLISDVVFHEWGHGLDHNVGGIEDGAFSEGYGDIMSLIITKSNILGIGFRIGGGAVRDLEPDKIYPQDRGGGVHSEGLIIGSTMWDLFKDITAAHGDIAGQALMQKYAFKMIFPASRYTEVYDALLTIDDDDADLTNNTPNYCIINKNFAAHGLATADEACNLAAINEFRIDDSVNGNGNGYIDPGETVELWMVARNAASEALSGLTGAVSVNGAGVSVNDADLAWGEIPANDAALSDDAASIAIAEDAVCGSTFNVNVRLTAGARNATAATTLTLGRLDGEVEANSAAGLPAPITDNNTTTAAVNFTSAQWADGVTISAARLKFDVTHTYVGDLTISLVAPNGTRVQILRGSGADDDIHFDQDITDKLAAFAGQGTWTLEVNDSANQDVGTLDSFSLTLTPAKYECE